MQVFTDLCDTFFDGGVEVESDIARDECGRFLACGFHHFNIAERFHANISESPLTHAIEFS